MSIEDKTKTGGGEGGTGGGAPAAGGEPAKPPPGGEPPKADPPKPPAGAAGGEPAKPPAGAAGGEPPAPKGPRDLRDDEEPEGDERVTLSAAAFRKRIERGTRKSLLAQFGTDDPEVLKAKLKKAEDYEAEQEKQRLAALSEQDRLKEQLKKADAEKVELERRIADQDFDRLADSQEAQMRDVAVKHIKPKFWKHAKSDLADHLVNNFTEKELENLPPAKIDEFFKRYVEENPEYAAAAGPAIEATPEVKKAPIVNGPINKGSNARPLPLDAQKKFEGKTLAPGKPNSMTAAEASEYKRAHGLNW